VDVGFNIYFIFFPLQSFLNIIDCEKTQLKQQRHFTKSIFEMLSVAVDDV